MELPFDVGALCNRKEQIHAVFGGQQQGGISTPKEHPLVIAFTGEAGVSHGYHDFWDDDEVFHYFGEGQVGDMKYVAGNRAIGEHVKDGKTLVVFQMMGKGRPYRYLGRFMCLSSYVQPDTPDREGQPRSAIVFRLRSLEASLGLAASEKDQAEIDAAFDDVGATSARRETEVRTKQRLFRERLIGVEKGCRLTGIEDLRFLRASHIKPWADSSHSERVDGENGLLLAPHADLLFDRGWISFSSSGQLLISDALPCDMPHRLGLNLKKQLPIGRFSRKQLEFIEFHRDVIFLGTRTLEASAIDDDLPNGVSNFDKA
ncbi:HNH endonuclease signature motif containing protein [Stenotrophomonas lactitubi]|uniref:HNH endonuclease n=1 Tax=Stenotrophomonas lactitubi TaxID=2045214 RepID=UPI0022492B76|nr:HNH endonuclease signature motif containing protein [Stenotrophomonas lactitubi]MCX2895479.1 HNH endonuclease signature motif containing protein [Stenotrophomonas lactitubi]